MKYLEFTFTTQPSTETVHDVLAAVLADVGFDSFDPSESEVKAYVKADAFDEALLAGALDSFPLPGVKIGYTRRTAEDKDWNEEWEKNFYEPLVLDDLCTVHCTFHKNVPAARYDIVIDPRMSFGTGHHATTRGMMRYLLDMDMTGKQVLDMGCGTSILAILARKRGAQWVLAVDNDEWCVSNSLENLRLNGTDNVQVELGDAASLAGRGPFDVIIANINRNILLHDMKSYAACLAPGGTLLMSGFYVEDIPFIDREARSLGLQLTGARQENNWAALSYKPTV